MIINYLNVQMCIIKGGAGVGREDGHLLHLKRWMLTQQCGLVMETLWLETLSLVDGGGGGGGGGGERETCIKLCHTA